MIFINRQRTNIIIRLKLLIGCINRTDWQTYWHIALDSELPFHTSLFHEDNKDHDEDIDSFEMKLDKEALITESKNFWNQGNLRKEDY